MRSARARRDRRRTTEDRAIPFDEEQPTDDPKAEDTRPGESTEGSPFADGIGAETTGAPAEVADTLEAGSEELAARPIEEAAPASLCDDTSAEPSTDDQESPEPDLPKKRRLDWADETSGHRIEAELGKIEAEVRRLLADRDTKRKRKLTGTRRWQELEDDIIAWRYSGKIDESALDRLKELIRRRHYLFTRLRFLAGTRPTWNS